MRPAAQFVAVFNSMFDTRFRSASSILRRERTDDQDAHINTAFNVVAVANGLRGLALLFVPTRWVPPSELGVLHQNWRPGVGFVADARTIQPPQLAALAARYGDDAFSLDTNHEVGRRLGYMHPDPKDKHMMDGTVTMQLRLPTTPLDVKRDMTHTIVSEFGPQSVKTAAVNVALLRAMQRQWAALAKRVDSEMDVYVEMQLY